MMSEKWTRRLAAGFIVLLFLFELVLSIQGYQNIDHHKNHHHLISEAQLYYHGKRHNVQLPYILKNTKKHEQATITFTIHGELGDMLLLKSDYSPIKVYANKKLIYSYGAHDERPSFMVDPAIQVNSILLPFDTNVHQLQIRIEYQTLNGRDSLKLEHFFVGKRDALSHYLAVHSGLSRGLSIYALTVGVLLVAFSLFIKYNMPEKRIFYSGLFIFLMSLWQYGQNDLTLYIRQNFNLMYLLSYSAFFFFMVPFISFMMVQFKERGHDILITLKYINALSAITAVILQLLGILSFHTSYYYFVILEFLTLTFIVFVVVYYTFTDRRKDDGLFALLTFNLWFFSVIDLCLRIYDPRYSTSLITVATNLLLVLLFLYLQHVSNNMIKDNQKAISLANDLHQLEISIDAQKKHNDILIEHENEVRRQIHDLRHHIVSIKQLADEGKIDAIQDYINNLSQTIPSNNVKDFCDNQVANALLSYYYDEAHKNGIKIDIQVHIPSQNEHISDNVICVIIGNLLENAMEACQRIQKGDKYIIFKSMVQGQLLIFSMDNTFDGTIRKKDDHFVSAKVADGSRMGIGLRSVMEIAHQYNGEGEFEAEGTIFHSSVYLER